MSEHGVRASSVPDVLQSQAGAAFVREGKRHMGVRTDEGVLARAEGTMMGLLVGDALGSRVEFKTQYDIRVEWPGRLTELIDGGAWDTIAGQPTDDGEMAITLARAIIAKGGYRSEYVFDQYVKWFDSGPFDYGGSTRRALKTHDPSLVSEANGALMRAAPIGIFGTLADQSLVRDWAHLDARLTHPNRVTVQVNELFCRAIAYAIRYKVDNRELYARILEWAHDPRTDPSVVATVVRAETDAPEEYFHRMGWVLIAFGNALYQLVNAPDLEEGVIDTVNRGGDTDTNGAVAGALLGSVYGIDEIPERWQKAVLNARPMAGDPRVKHPRPRDYWPVDCLELARELLIAGYAWRETE